MLNCLKEYNLFLKKIVLSDKATFHLSGKVNHHNVIIWGSQNPLKLSKFTGRWIGCGGCIPWPPRSPSLTPMDFSFWGFMKDNVYILPMPVGIQEIQDRTVNTIALVDANFLNELWDKLEYCLYVCHITRGSHIEHLYVNLKVSRNAL
jgi:hypothetical protein